VSSLGNISQIRIGTQYSIMWCRRKCSTCCDERWNLRLERSYRWTTLRIGLGINLDQYFHSCSDVRIVIKLPELKTFASLIEMKF